MGCRSGPALNMETVGNTSTYRTISTYYANNSCRRISIPRCVNYGSMNNYYRTFGYY